MGEAATPAPSNDTWIIIVADFSPRLFGLVADAIGLVVM